MSICRNVWQKGETPSAGFTIIELLTVVLIVGILSAIAIPAYQDHITKTRRAEAMSALTSAAAALERYKASNNFSYFDACSDGQGCTNEILTRTIPNDGAGPFYNMCVQLSPDNRQFILTATATAEWAARDGILQIDNTGAKSWQNSDGDTFGCWPTTNTAACDPGPMLDDTPPACP